MDSIMPMESIRVYPTDAPWMSVKPKELICLRQISFRSNEKGPQYKGSENAVNTEKNFCKAKFYASEVQDLSELNHYTLK